MMSHKIRCRLGDHPLEVGFQNINDQLMVMSIVIVIMPPVDEKLQRVLVTLLFLDEQSF
jgi:hypothetical protein